MALSTRVRLAGLGGVLALGVLGATGIAYAADGTGGTSYVTTVDDGTARSGSQQAPGDRAPRSGDREDCPEKGGGSGEGAGGTGSAAPQESAPAGPADA